MDTKKRRIFLFTIDERRLMCPFNCPPFNREHLSRREYSALIKTLSTI
jgi:hypothetical protein